MAAQEDPVAALGTRRRPAGTGGLPDWEIGGDDLLARRLFQTGRDVGRPVMRCMSFHFHSITAAGRHGKVACSGG